MTAADSSLQPGRSGDDRRTWASRLSGWLIAAGVPPADVELAKRLVAVAVFVFAFTAGFSRLERMYSQKFFDITGDANWIRARHDRNSDAPVAFFAAHDFDLPANRYYTHLKILGDPEYTLWINGRLISSRLVTEDKSLDLYDLSDLVQTGRNRIVVAVRAPQGTGELIAAIDLAPEIANRVISGGDWKIYKTWSPSLLTTGAGEIGQSPVVIGEPPVGRWDFLDATRRRPDPPDGEILEASRTLETRGLLPSIRMSSGVAVAVANLASATTFDFGFTKGRLRLTLDRVRPATHEMKVRFANDRRELSVADWNLRPVVFAAGETVVTLPETRSFRYVMVFGRGIRAQVVRDPASPR